MLALEEAQERIFKLLSRVSAESLAPAQAHERVVTTEIASPIDLPPFDNSAMDGYAVQSSDLLKASHESPISLRLISTIPAGGTVGADVTVGTAIRIFTGSPLPSGADAVIMQEDTQVSGENIACLDRVRPWENIRLRGEDIKTGTIVVKRGERISAGAIGSLNALGLAEVEVARAPRVGVIATGDELVEPGQPLTGSKIYESNRALITALLKGITPDVRVLPIVRDSLAETCQALKEGFASSDVLISSGGVSVGEHDHVKAAFEQLGGKINFWRVAIKPGKPFVCGQLEGKLFFGSPGNPVSAFVTFLLLVRPALLRWQGAINWDLPRHPGVLQEAISNRGDRRHFMRVSIGAGGGVRLAGAQASHVLSSLASANGLVDVPPNTTLEKGQLVEVLRWEL